MRAFVWQLVVGVAWAAEPLPKELAQRLDLARMLPPGMAASTMLRYVEPARIDREDKAALAFEAYLLATAFGVEPIKVYAVRQNNGPLDWVMRTPAHQKNPQSAALLAWSIYDAHYDRRRQKPLEFPVRRLSAPESCRVALVDDPLDYFEAAQKAGPRLFSQAIETARNPIEHGRLMAVFVRTQQRPVTTLLRWLTVFVPDRHFAYAMAFTPYHNSMLKIASEVGLNEARALFSGYAAFLERHWAQKRCLGNEDIQYGGLVDEFNRAAAEAEKKFEGARMPRLRENSWRARAVEPDSYSETQEDLRDLVLLRLKILNSPPDDVNTAATLREVEEFRAPDRLPTGAKLLQKNFAYREMLTKYLNTADEKRVMYSWLHYFAYSRALREAPQVWMATTRDVIEWVGKDEGRRKMAESAGDPALAALLRLEVLEQQ